MKDLQFHLSPLSTRPTTSSMKIISVALATFLRPHLSRAFVTANSSTQTRTVLKMSTVTSNPLLNSKELPKFTSISPSDLTPAIESILSQLESDFSSLENTLSTVSPDYEAVLPEVEKIQHPLNYAWGIAGHLKGVKDSEELRKAYEEVNNSLFLMLKHEFNATFTSLVSLSLFSRV